MTFFICGVTTTGMIDTRLVPFAHDHGFSTGVTGAAVALLAAFNILATRYLVRALSLLFLLAAREPALLLAFGVLFGLVDFAVLAPTQLLASRYFGGHSLGFVFGVLSLSHQVGSAVGAYVPGLLYTATGSYAASFVAAALALLVGAALSIMLPRPGVARRQVLVAEVA